MDVRIKFLGAAGTVTGSKYLIEIDEYRIMVDCGLYQGVKELRLRNWDPFPVAPTTLDAIILTHAHIDHSGYLPRIFREGFEGNVHCTEPTEALLEIMLLDAGRLQEEEAAFARKKGYSKHTSPQPLFTEADAKRVLPHIVSHPFHKEITMTEFVSVKFHHAGHILGASTVELLIKGDQQEKTILFSGDLGPFHNPLHFSPEKHKKADIVLVESTYGNKTYASEGIEQHLIELVYETQEAGGCLIIPAFSVGRTQLLLYYFWKLLNEKKIPDWPVYIDSPMAISVTNLYKKFDSCHKLRDPEPGHKVFDHPNFNYVTHQSISKSLNERKGHAIILSASGMVTGGRILHHLFHRLPNPKDRVLFTGYQAEGSRGRALIEGEKQIKIFGETVSVNAKIKTMEGLSAHADKNDLIEWLNGFESAPKLTCIVHGEQEGACSLSNHLHAQGWNTVVPTYLESIQLFQGI